MEGSSHLDSSFVVASLLPSLGFATFAVMVRQIV
jgi:hypothetical protein